MYIIIGTLVVIAVVSFLRCKKVDEDKIYCDIIKQYPQNRPLLS